MYTSLFQPIVVAMEVMSPVARYLKFIVGADLLPKFQCNVTAVECALLFFNTTLGSIFDAVLWL